MVAVLGRRCRLSQSVPYRKSRERTIGPHLECDLVRMHVANDGLDLIEHFSSVNCGKWLLRDSNLWHVIPYVLAIRAVQRTTD